MTRQSDLKTLIRARMAVTGERYTAAAAALADEWGAAERFHATVLARFFDGERLRSIPARRKPRVAVLLELLRRFAPDRAYTEPEVNDLLRPAHEDVAMLRRELVDYGFLDRADGVYRMADAGPDVDPRFAADLPVDLERRLRQLRAGR